MIGIFQTIEDAVTELLEELCAYSRVELCALDLQTGRIKRISAVGIADRIMPEKPETGGKAGKRNGNYICGPVF